MLVCVNKIFMIQIFVKEGRTLITVGKVEEWGKRFGDPVVSWNRISKTDLKEWCMILYNIVKCI